MLYDIVKDAASKQRYSIRQVEQECGLSNGSIGKWRQMSPRWDVVIRVATFLSIPMSVLKSEALK